MIGSRGYNQLLLPARPLFVAASLLVALAYNCLPLGRQPAAPDLLMVVLMFWAVHQPLKVGMTVAFVFGLAMDVNNGALLGQHALAYAVLASAASGMRRRLTLFNVFGQAVQLLPVFVGVHAVSLVVRMLAGGMFPGWAVLAAPVLEAALWPLASLVLLAPQRRAPDPDANRPL